MHSFVYVHKPMHECGLLDSQEYSRAFQNLQWKYHSPTFPFGFFVCLFFDQLVVCSTAIIISGRLFFINAFSLPCESAKSHQIKKTLANGEPLDRWNWSNDNSLGMGLWKCSNPILPPPKAIISLLAFTFVVGCCFPRLLHSWEGGRKYDKLKCHKACCLQDSNVSPSKYF